jgi:hypothetical protein
MNLEDPRRQASSLTLRIRWEVTKRRPRITEWSQPELIINNGSLCSKCHLYKISNHTHL